MNEQKRKLEVEGEKKQGEEKYTLEHYKEFQKRLRLMNQGPENKAKDDKKAHEHKQKEKVKNKEERRQENKRPDPPKSKSPEEVFELKPGEILSGAELKRRYFELLKQNHPDRVASMGAEFKTLAEKNTKEINKAYEALKRKAS